jgi:hypothetical protein
MSLMNQGYINQPTSNFQYLDNQNSYGNGPINNMYIYGGNYTNINHSHYNTKSNKGGNYHNSEYKRGQMEKEKPYNNDIVFSDMQGIKLNIRYAQ